MNEHLTTGELTALARTQALSMILGQLHTNEITDTALLNAFAHTPREAYVPKAFARSAYVDQPLLLDSGRYMLPPLTAARLITMADIQPHERVLIVGSATSYEAALIAQLASKVWAVDSNAEFIARSQKLVLDQQIANVELHHVASMADGFAQSAPYDAIIVLGGISHAPDSLTSQLSHGGRLASIHEMHQPFGQSYGTGKLFTVMREAVISAPRNSHSCQAAMLPDFAAAKTFAFS